MKVRGRACFAAPFQTRISNVKRLLNGVTPYGSRAPLAGDKPTKLRAGLWVDAAFSEAVKVRIGSLQQCLPHSLPNENALDGDDDLLLTSAFSHGRKMARRLLQ